MLWAIAEISVILGRQKNNRRMIEDCGGIWCQLAPCPIFMMRFINFSIPNSAYIKVVLNYYSCVIIKMINYVVKELLHA